MNEHLLNPNQSNEWTNISIAKELAFFSSELQWTLTGSTTEAQNSGLISIPTSLVTVTLSFLLV